MAPAALPGSTRDGVLPRVLRRPARFIARLGSAELLAPRFGATLMTAGLFAITGLYGAAQGGHFPAIVQAMTAHSGFAIEDVRISGHRETSEIDILEKLGLDGWTSLVGFDVDAARERIAALPWVQSAAVKKIYPDAIEVAIVEKKPFAIWQHGADLSLIERSGAIISPFGNDRFATLPLVVGQGAAVKAQAIVAKVAEHPGLASRVKGYVRVADRRWDLRLENGVTVKLPEAGEATAIAGLVVLDGEQGVLSRDILAVDLRLEDRLVVQLTPDAAERRKTEIAERMKRKKAGTERHI